MISWEKGLEAIVGMFFAEGKQEEGENYKKNLGGAGI